MTKEFYRQLFQGFGEPQKMVVTIVTVTRVSVDMRYT